MNICQEPPVVPEGSFFVADPDGDGNGWLVPADSAEKAAKLVAEGRYVSVGCPKKQSFIVSDSLGRTFTVVIVCMEVKEFMVYGL